MNLDIRKLFDIFGTPKKKFSSSFLAGSFIEHAYGDYIPTYISYEFLTQNIPIVSMYGTHTQHRMRWRV